MKCAVIVPVGPGHELLAEDAVASVHAASAVSPGMFSEIAVIKVDDTRGEVGRSAARNSGIRSATRTGAEWSFFLDADDILAPAAFRNVAPYIGKYDAIWGTICELADDEETGIPRNGQLTEVDDIAQLLGNDPWLTLQMGHFVKTHVAAATPFDTALDDGEDFDYYLRTWSGFTCRKVAAPFFYNRRHNHAGGPRGATDRDWRIAVQRIICKKCAATEFHADFEHRAEKFRFYVCNPFNPIQRHHLKGRFAHQAQLDYVQQWVAQGANIIDVGSYVGNHAVYYSRFLNPRRMTLVEANPDVVVELQRNLVVNGVSSACVVQLAASATEGSYKLVCDALGNRTDARLQKTACGDIRGLPLDAIISEQVDVLRIDVGDMGHEVLAGATQLIARSRCKIIIETAISEQPAYCEWFVRNNYAVVRTFRNDLMTTLLAEPLHTP